ncbi:hypothetical protein ANO11243_078930 [Dothideomycetidae sp. 11243]|nr:hypothetical protein ANO11243_078930 [fungal sp. No.11243]
MSSSNKVYLVTGAARGIGLGLVTALLARPSTTVIASTRTPTPALSALPLGPGSRLIPLQLDSKATPSEASAALATLSSHGITHIDFLIANAGVHGAIKRTLDLSIAHAADIFAINSVGPIVLAGAARDLLRAADKPVFAVTSSIVGSSTLDSEKWNAFPTSPYGTSKAALNWFVHRLHFEETWLTSVAIHPGLIMTDMALQVDIGDKSWKDFGPISLEEGLSGYLKVVDTASENREKVGGHLVSYTGEVLPY